MPLPLVPRNPRRDPCAWCPHEGQSCAVGNTGGLACTFCHQRSTTGCHTAALFDTFPRVKCPTDQYPEAPMKPLTDPVITLTACAAFLLVVTVLLSHYVPSGVDPEVFITTTLEHVFIRVEVPAAGAAVLPLSAA